MEPGVVNKYLDLQTRETYKLLARLLSSPGDFFQEIRTYVIPSGWKGSNVDISQRRRVHYNGSCIRPRGYGHPEPPVVLIVLKAVLVTSKEDRYVALAETSMTMIAKVAVPGAFLVDIVPWCEFSVTNIVGSHFVLLIYLCVK